MVYAQVVVNHKTAATQIFTYLLTPEQLLKTKLGTLVEVPFRDATTTAIVIGLTKLTKVKSDKLKTIKRVLSKPLVTSNQIQLARWLADYYGSSLGEAFFAMLPEFSKRQFVNE